ncbi:MAG: glycine reductase, partial [Tissierellales bacterium]|nr:glycine reductase [Tissierellales bacterium]
VQGAEIASRNKENIDVVLIGPEVKTDLEVIKADNEDLMNKKMEDLLESGYLSSCITMHYSFPIGVSTVGKVLTPGLGKEMFIATTTGTTSTSRVEAMVKNTINGIIAAKASGVKKPKVGILNVDGAKQVEIALRKLKENGYEIDFGQSQRSDGGCVMRGNDLLTGSVDVMVTDTLTGNILMKMFSSFTTGGSYEASGFGYGPGIGEDYNKNILILSRASGAPVVSNAFQYSLSLVKGNLFDVSQEEYTKANKAGLKSIFKSISPIENTKNQDIKEPEKEVVTAQISGIDIMDLDEAVKCLWKENIYAESGMGCTGPIVLVSDDNLDKSLCVLKNKNFIVTDKIDC